MSEDTKATPDEATPMMDGSEHSTATSRSAADALSEATSLVTAPFRNFLNTQNPAKEPATAPPPPDDKDDYDEIPKTHILHVTYKSTEDAGTGQPGPASDEASPTSADPENPTSRSVISEATSLITDPLSIFRNRQSAVTGQPGPGETAPPMTPPPGVPVDGKWVEERYCGLITWVVAVSTGLVCSYCCPCDRRTVWISGGVKFNEKGAMTNDDLCLNPCPPNSCCNPQPDHDT